MPDDVQVIVLYAAAAIALIVVVGKGGAAWAEAKVRRARGDRLLGEERLRAYAAMVEVGIPTKPAVPAVPAVPPAPPSSSRPTALPGGTFPDPHLLERIQALEAKVAALEAQVGAPAAAELAGMRAPPADDGRPEAPRPPGLRAFP